MDVIEKLKRLHKVDDMVDYECIIGKGEPNECHALATTKVIRVPSGERAVITTFLDVSEMVVLKNALQKAEEGNRAKSSFLFAMSHDLRTPMNAIIGYAELMERHWGDNELTTNYLHKLKGASQFLLALIGNVLEIARIESGKETLNEAPWNLKKINDTLEIVLDREILNKQLHVARNIEIQHADVYCDSLKIQEIIMNLVSNAIKYTPQGGTVNLQLATEEIEERNYVRISVSDTGIGISESDLPYIFDRFYQVGNEGDEKIGSGIGLHLVREYVNIHGGRIKVDSQIDRGSVFTVWLPMDLKPEPNELPEEIIGTEASDVKEKETTTSTVDDNLKKLLLVEDNQEFRTFLKEQLEDFYQIIEAADGEEGERKAIEENPNLIISDIMMPKVDGIELCRRIKTNVQTSHIPVILLTARTADDIKINSYEVGADSYMSKPFNFDMLMVRIEKLIEQQEKRKQEFRKNIEVNPSAITITSVDEQLIQKCLEYIEKNMDIRNIGVERIEWRIWGWCV